MTGFLRAFGVLAWIVGIVPVMLLASNGNTTAAWMFVPTMIGAVLGGVLLFAAAEALTVLHSIDASLKGDSPRAEPVEPQMVKPVSPPPPRRDVYVGKGQQRL